MSKDDDDLRRMIREFREGVSADLGEHRDRLDRLEIRMGGLEGRMDGLEGRVTDLAGEMRTRTLTMETAILNSIGELGGQIRRLEGRLVDHIQHHHGDAA